MSPINSSPEPAFSDAEREELGHLTYLDARLNALHERGLITPDAHETIVAESQGRRDAIELSGRFRNAVNQATKLAKKDPRDALNWAECARELDKSREEAWNLVVTLKWDLGDREGATACCRLASERFPRFQTELDRLMAAQVRLAEEERLAAQRVREETNIKGWLAQARQALESGRDVEVIALGQQILAIRPNHVDALANTAFAQQRSGQIEQALASYQALVRLQPANKTWSQWVRNVQLRGIAKELTATQPEPVPVQSTSERLDAPPVPEVNAPPPAFAWSSFAGEFLKEHSQELLLCLAVLLIVVSSTVGAHMLLGDLLWSPVGKCALAMIATLLFAAFGAGLLRWGAARAGRMMLVATLIVVPIHFMLAGEMKLFHQPSAFVIAFLAIEGASLIYMVRWVSGMLAPSPGARFLTAALLLLSVGSATTARGSPLGWDLQFASFQVSPMVFLAAVWALGARRWGETSKEHRDFVYMMLGLLGFALVACLVRTGAYALRLAAPLYGLPVMLVATACVHTARRLAGDEPDSQRLALLRFGGYGLSGLAFALILASPPDASPVYFANTLAVSIVGLGLYVVSLRIDRHPAFLYLAFGAIVAGRLGAHYFLAGRLRVIEEMVRELLGYPHHLPTPFRAILVLPINVALGGLSLWFVRNWGDRRLARHCHYIGLPLSIAACIWSGFEPLAAWICLSGYAILYLLAVWIFAVPRLTYLAAAALAGACYFGTTLVPGITLADQALAAALLGCVFWAARAFLRRRHAAPAYHVPWLQAALALTAVAIVAATLHLASVGVGSWTGAGAFAVIACLAFMLNREQPRGVWAHLAILSFIEFTICGLGLAMGLQNLAPYHCGLLFMVDGLGMLAAAEILRFWLNRSEPEAAVDQTDGVVKSRWIGTILAAIPRSTLVLTLVADGMGILSIERTWLTGLVFLLGAASLLWVTRLVRWQTLVYLGLAHLVAATLDLSAYAAGWNDPGLLAGWLAVSGALLGLALWAASVASRRLRLPEFYIEPCVQTVFALTGGAMVAATAHIVLMGAGSWIGAGAFTVVVALAFMLNRDRPNTIWAQLALVSFVELTVCGLGLAMGIHGLAPHHYGLLFIADGLTFLSAAELLSYWLKRSLPQTGAGQSNDVDQPRWVGTILAVIPGSTIVLTFVGDSLGLVSVERTWLAGLVFLLGMAPLLWVTRLVQWRTLVYLGLAQLVVGALELTSCAAGWNDTGLLAGWLAVAGALLGLALWGGGVAARRVKLSEFYTEPCFHTAFALTVGAYVAALDARYAGREAYALAAAALGLNVLITMLLARTWRLAELTYVAVFHVVTATYLVLFSVGKNDPAMAYVLGLAAVIEAVVLWAIGFTCQRSRDTWTSGCARPLFHWAVWLTIAAIVLSDRSSVVLAMVAASFLLTVKSLPRVEWLYGTCAALLGACYFRWLGQLPRIELLACATLAAFVLWAVGVWIQRHKAAMYSRLGLLPLAYEAPLFHSSIMVALIALALRVDLSVEQRVAATGHGWFPLSLSALSLIMLRAYPRRLCVHTSLAFLTWTVVAAIVPSLTSVCFFGLAGMTLALGFLLIERLVRPHEQALCAQLGVIGAGYSQVVRGWALSVFGLMVSLVIGVVAGEMTWTMAGQSPIPLALSSMDWWAMLATLGLTGVFLMTLGTDPEGWGALEPEHLVVALLWVAVAMLWWVGVACSPLVGRVVSAGVYYPLATAAAGLATVRIVRRHAHDRSWHELGWLGDLRFESMGRLLSIQACVLSGLAVVFTKGAIEPATAGTLIVVALTLGLVALAVGWQGTAIAGSVAWSAAWGVAGIVVAQRLGWTVGELRATAAAVGVLSAAFSLLAVAGWLRSDQSRLTSQNSSTLISGLESPSPLAWAMELVAFASSLIAAFIVLAAGTNAAALTGWGTTVGVGVIMGAALLLIFLVPRWQGVWLIYLAQAVVVLAYVDYRLAFDHPIAFDAIVLTLMGYLDLGIAEVLERLEHKAYARPARFFSLMLPSLPLLQVIASRALDEVELFYLLAAGTFYGIACGRLRWKTLGYAAAVLYNAALWVLWDKFGWKLSTHPQFFLVPVGLSTILFAEVNRRELGRANVNTIRTVGLTIIYLSLAVPIWRYESFGAWVTLLIGSLVGVFLGIGLRLQTFLWMGLTTFVLTLVYEMGRVSLDYAPAKWAIMLAMGIALVMFVALNEKKQIVGTMRLYFDQARLWE